MMVPVKMKDFASWHRTTDERNVMRHLRAFTSGTQRKAGEEHTSRVRNAVSMKGLLLAAATLNAKSQLLQ